MVSFMEFVKTGVHKILFPLRPAVIASGRHQIPVDILFYSILRYAKTILTFSYIFNNIGIYSGFFPDFPQRRILIVFALLYGSLGQYPAFRIYACRTCTRSVFFLDILPPRHSLLLQSFCTILLLKAPTVPALCFFIGSIPLFSDKCNKFNKL